MASGSALAPLNCNRAATLITRRLVSQPNRIANICFPPILLKNSEKSVPQKFVQMPL